MTAARRYREITGELTETVERIRRADQAHAAELLGRLGELDEAMTRAAERAALTRLSVNLHWEAALEALWDEQWMTLRPLPAPNAPTVVRDLDELDTRMELRYQELVDALHRRGLPLRRRDG